jgi:hypothetical protein
MRMNSRWSWPFATFAICVVSIALWVIIFAGLLLAE